MLFKKLWLANGLKMSVIPLLSFIKKKKLYLTCAFLGVMALDSASLYAQTTTDGSPNPAQAIVTEQPEQPQTISEIVRATDAATVFTGDHRIKLWGIETINSNNPVFKLKSRTALENKIGNMPVRCTIKQQHQDSLIAQCINSKEEDLSLAMLQQGYVSVDRAAVYGSVFEEPYLQAEQQAQRLNLGIWAIDTSTTNAKNPRQERNFILLVTAIAFVFILALAVFSYYMMRGFKDMVSAQNETLNLAGKERALRDREKFLIASMLCAEIKENKTKIEAYLMIYEELLKDIKDTTHTPKYKKSGEIIQKQPALSRSIFDGNTDRLDMMGETLASELIHYYARIKTIPDYVDLSPDTAIEDALKLAESVVEHARKLDKLSDMLAHKFIKAGLVKTTG